MIRTRIAPSPTGYFHIGTARTALYNYLFAKKFSGKFIVRMEDTDPTRSKKEYEEDILSGLKWLGLQYDEGPDIGGPFAPYRQSERLEIYKKYANILIEKGFAYYCQCSPSKLEEERKKLEREGLPFRYPGYCRDKGYDKGAVRFKARGGKVKFKDLIRGEVVEESSLWGDFIIMRSDGTPLFYFSNLIDDSLMEITHVIRGEDHISNTFKQVVIEEALGFKIPVYAHLPLLVNADRSKISKRYNPVSVSKDFKEKGILSEALVNYLALLGWAPSDNQEFFTLSQLIDKFDLQDVQKSSAAWDQKKLYSINSHYIREFNNQELATRLKAFLPTLSLEGLERLAPLLRERIKILSEAKEVAAFALKRPSLNRELIPEKSSNLETAKQVISASIKALEQLEDWTKENLEKTLESVREKLKCSRGELLWPLRYSLTGSLYSPGAFEVLDYLGKKESLSRLCEAEKLLR